MNVDRAALEAAADAIREQAGFAPRTAVVLGSGLGSAGGRLPDAKPVEYSDIPGLPSPAVEGHAATLWCSPTLGAVAFGGRVHAYEGHDMATVTFAARAAILAGARVLVLTNAAGGIASGFAPGDLVLLTDHMNFAARNPLVGMNDDTLGPRFPDMTAVYDPDLRALARDVDPDLKEGVYAWLLGPTFETPAEIRAMRTLGADLVGMSTVPEAIVARHMGARVLGMSLVTNLAAGLGTGPLSHEEVQEAAAAARERFLSLLIGVLTRLQSGSPARPA